MFGRKKKKQTPALFGSRIEPDCAYCAFHADGVQKKCLAGQLGGENTDLTDEINKTFSLFFRKFNYKISDVIVGTANHSATVSVKLTTIDSKVLARDFKAELLRTQITESAQAQKGNIKDSSRSPCRFVAA